MWFFSWFGISCSKDLIESFFFLEMVYLSLVLLCNFFSFLTNFYLFDLFQIFILFFSICDSILGLILVLITFNINKNITLNSFKYLNG